jgi:hypothetical protein
MNKEVAKLHAKHTKSNTTTPRLRSLLKMLKHLRGIRLEKGVT